LSEERNTEKNTPEEAPESGAPEGTTEPGALFDLMGEGKPKKTADANADAKAKRGEQTSGSGKVQKKAWAKAEPVRYKEGTEVRYQRHSLALPREMTAKEVLDWLSEDDFPELAYEETELRHDKEKDRLVPVRKAQKKGGYSLVEVHQQPPANAGGPSGILFPPVMRLLGHDGVYEVRHSPLGSFVARLEDGPPLVEGFFPNVPPAPASLLGRVVALFKERPDTEALVSVVYDTDEDEHHLIWQGEHADASSVHYTPLPDDERYLVVAEIHSHHRMRPFFSSDDDASEKRLACYGVVGHVDRERPLALFRYPCGRTVSGKTRFRSLRAEQVFAPAPEVWSLIEQPRR